jgi:hypothetical protein
MGGAFKPTELAVNPAVIAPNKPSQTNSRDPLQIKSVIEKNENKWHKGFY